MSTLTPTPEPFPLPPTATDPTRSSAVARRLAQLTDPTAGVAAGTAWNMEKDPTRPVHLRHQA